MSSTNWINEDNFLNCPTKSPTPLLLLNCPWNFLGKFNVKSSTLDPTIWVLRKSQALAELWKWKATFFFLFNTYPNLLLGPYGCPTLVCVHPWLTQPCALRKIQSWYPSSRYSTERRWTSMRAKYLTQLTIAELAALRQKQLRRNWDELRDRSSKTRNEE